MVVLWGSGVLGAMVWVFGIWPCLGSLHVVLALVLALTTGPGPPPSFAQGAALLRKVTAAHPADVEAWIELAAILERAPASAETQREALAAYTSAVALLRGLVEGASRAVVVGRGGVSVLVVGTFVAAVPSTRAHVGDSAATPTPRSFVPWRGAQAASTLRSSTTWPRCTLASATWPPPRCAPGRQWPLPHPFIRPPHPALGLAAG